MSFTEHDATDLGQDAARSPEEPRLPTRRHDSADVEEAQQVHAPWRLRWLRRKNSQAVDSDSPQRVRKPFRYLRRLLVASALLLVLAVAGVVGYAAWLRHAMHAALPQIDGALRVPGLSAPVTVTRDAQGVPSITAANLDDLLFAQGFVTAQDRLWQMDSLRRHAAGELAEVLGSKLVEHDRTQRILQFRATADRAVQALPADQLHQLEAYARGVNAFLDSAGERLPVEFRLLHYTPAPWRPRDSILVSLAMFQDLSTEFPTKMKREALAAHLPAGLLSDLYPVGSWRDRSPAQPATDLTAPREIEQIPLDSTQTELATPADLLRIGAQTCEDCRAGSNNWAVSGSRSASGAPLLSNDMHLALNVPDIWYEAGLHAMAASGAAAFDAVGFTLPGAPFIIVGRNAHVAWGFTNLGADVQDVRVEHLRGSANDQEFQRPDGTWAAVAHTTEIIRVRGGSDIHLDVLTTKARIDDAEIVTPIISPLYPSEKRTLSLAWTAYDPGNLKVPFYAANTAESGAALVVAFATFGGPALNLIYADDAKHIGYHALGRIPVRGSLEHHPRVFVDPQPSQGSAPQDEEEEEKRGEPETSPEAFFQAPQTASPMMAGHLLLAGWQQSARRRKAVRQERRPESKQKKAAAKAKARREPMAQAPAEPAPAPLPIIDYAVGSPISPLPVDALDAAQQWAGYIPYSELPSIVDPQDGLLATANARITPDHYPYEIANDWIAPYRVERIYKLLAGRTGLTPADMLAVQTDVQSELDRVVAERLAYALDHASPAALGADTRRLRQAADVLRCWDGQMTPDSSAAAIVTAFRNVIWPTLLVPQIKAVDGKPDKRRPEEIAMLYQWGGQSVALELLLQHTPARWLPAGVTNWNDLMTTAVLRGLKEAHAPGDLARWRYGPQHPMEISHPVFSRFPMLGKLLGTATGTGAHETGGNSLTVRAVGAHFGPSERFTADLSAPSANTGNITTGQSGNPASPWYLDQFLPWLNGTTFPLPLHAAGGQHTLTLNP